MDEWRNFQQLGDEFLAAYVQVSPILVARPTLIGHAAELYFKAVLLQGGLTLPEVKKHNHDLKCLLCRCRERHPKLPVQFEFRDTVLAALRDTRGSRMGKSLNPDDLKHFDEYRDLYYAAHAKGDLKYLGTTAKQGLNALYVPCPSSTARLLLHVFDPIRGYLGIQPDIGTVIRGLLERPHMRPVEILDEYDIQKRAQPAASP